MILLIYRKCNSEIQKQGEIQMNEVKKMNTKQFQGIIKMIIQMIKDDTPKEQLLKWLEKLIE